MKILLMFVPILIFLLFMRLGSGILASGTVSVPSILIIAGVGMVLALAMRPKNKGTKPASDLEKKARGEFAKEAFADNPQLEAKFLSAIKDYNGNMPKSALNKLNKLAPLCTDDKEVYAVAMATAQCHLILGKTNPAIREYTRAMSIHSSPDVSVQLGSCHQRVGNLDKARSFYEYALDLDENYLEARSILATTYVADGDYDLGLEHAMQVLEKDENHASALATAAICYGLTNEPLLSKRYTELAVENGYSKKKIEETISALGK